MMTRTFAARLLVGLGVAAACASPTADRTGGLMPSVAVVHGRVVTDDGGPVAGALLRAFVHPVRLGGCAADGGALAGSAESDAAGIFTIAGRYLHVAREDMCVTLEVRPAAGSGLRARSVAGAEVTFIHQSNTPPVDSVRIDVLLAREP